jgi:hypothetical protein
MKAALTTTVVPPVVAYISAAITSVGNAVIAFGVIGVTQATAIEAAAVGVLSAAFLIANSLHAKAAPAPAAAK